MKDFKEMYRKNISKCFFVVTVLLVGSMNDQNIRVIRQYYLFCFNQHFDLQLILITKLKYCYYKLYYLSFR